MERYNEYKNSGIYFIPDIPKSWQVLKAKYLFKQEKREVRPEDEIVTCFRDGQVTLRKNRRTEGFTNSMKEIGYQGVRKGDLVIHNMDAFAGAIGVSDSDGKGTPVYACCTPKRDDINQYYYCYLLRYLARNGFILSLAKGIRERSTDFRFNDFKELYLPVPSKEEQDAIVSYIDLHSTKIDEAIAQQQKMIDLLNERKQIIINNAVTKGLNPDAPMKDSGVEWIGEIPEGWEVMKMKHFVEITDGTHDTPRYVDPSNNTYPLVTSRCIVNGNIDLSLANHIAEQDYKEIAVRSYVCKYDVIMPMIGTVGNPAIIDFDDSIAIKNVALFRTHGDKYKSKYLKSLLNSFIVKEQFAMYNKGGVQNFVSQDILKNLTILVPKNIREIVCFIDNEILKIESPMSAINHQIALLQERKQIIINEVVTGKVKVG